MEHKEFRGHWNYSVFYCNDGHPLHFGQKLQNIQLKGRDPHKTMDFS